MDMRANATGIQHLGIPTAQVEQTIAFYEKLGFEMMWRSGPGCPRCRGSTGPRRPER